MSTTCPCTPIWFQIRLCTSKTSKHAFTCMSQPCAVYSLALSNSHYLNHSAIFTPKHAFTCMFKHFAELTCNSISLLHSSLQKFTCIVIKQVIPCILYSRNSISCHHFRNPTHSFVHAVCSSHF